MIIHGERDTLVPVGDAREFAAEMKRVSRAEVRYIELPGAEHAFDLWPSVRTARDRRRDRPLPRPRARRAASTTSTTDTATPVVHTAGSTSDN